MIPGKVQDLVLIGWSGVAGIQAMESVPPKLYGPGAVPVGMEVATGQAKALGGLFCSGGGSVPCHMHLRLSSPVLGYLSLSCCVTTLLGSRI